MGMDDKLGSTDGGSLVIDGRHTIPLVLRHFDDRRRDRHRTNTNTGQRQRQRDKGNVDRKLGFYFRGAIFTIKFAVILGEQILGKQSLQQP
jgi:hypothetical protein